MSRDGTGAVLAVDRTLCIGAAQCVLAAPAFFDQSEDDGLVLALTEPSGGKLPDAMLMAVRLCPSGALSLVDKELSGQDGRPKSQS